MQTSDPQVTLHDGLPETSFPDFANLLELAGWGSASGYADETIRQMAGASTIMISAFMGAQLVGYVRGFSDRVVVSHLSEILVHPSWRGRGVGSRLLRGFLAKTGHSAVYVESFVDEQEFFARHGLVPRRKLVACALSWNGSAAAQGPSEKLDRASPRRTRGAGAGG